MRLIADFHIHSRFSRACSNKLTLPNLERWAQVKGIDLMGTGDFTHPVWLQEISDQLEEISGGIYKLRREFKTDAPYQIKNPRPVRFILTHEIATIWSQDGKLRRMHTILVAPNLQSAIKLTEDLKPLAKLGSDGRPIIGISARELASRALTVDQNFLIIPAHAWTPWFAVFGSKSGFNSLEECFGDLTKHIYAIETGMSSDPLMNWQVSLLDKIALISCSDGHSLDNLGREATVFEIKNPEQFNFELIIKMIKQAAPNNHQDRSKDNYLDYTIEFFPEEGKYHYDGHRSCSISWDPEMSQKFAQRCPNCGQLLTIGVLSRVKELANRHYRFRPTGAPDFKSIVPLRDMISALFGLGKLTKRVNRIYTNLINNLGAEFDILLDHSLENIAKHSFEQLANTVGQMRNGKIKMIPGYDGVYGKLQLAIPTLSRQQISIF